MTRKQERKTITPRKDSDQMNSCTWLHFARREFLSGIPD